MFCYQCEQTARSTGCTAHGVCGKDPETAALQDLLIHMTEGLAQYAHRARQLGARDRDVDVFVIEALFTTVTNVDFDPRRVAELVRKGAAVRDRAKQDVRGCLREGWEGTGTTDGRRSAPAGSDVGRNDPPGRVADH